MKFFYRKASVTHAREKNFFNENKKKEREKEREREVNESVHVRGDACILEQLSKICMDNNFACIGVLISMQSAACSCFRR